MIKCEKCGNENQDTAKFCNNCGAKLEIHEDIFVCSKCGGELHGKQRFCTHCGAKMIYAEDENEAFGMPKNQKEAKTEIAVSAARAEVVKKEKCAGDKSLLIKISNIATTSIILLLALLAIISVFLPFAKMSASLSGLVDVKETQGLKYWFTDCWKDFSLQQSGYKFGTIVNFMSFLAAVVLVLVFGIMAIVKGIMSLISGQESKGLVRSASFAVMGSLQYFIFSAANFASSVTVLGMMGQEIKPGAGYSLIFVVLFFLIAVVIGKSIIGFINKDLSLKAMIFNCVMPFIVAIVLVISFKKPFVVSEMSAGEVYTGIFPILSTVTPLNNHAITQSDLIYAFILLVCCVVFGMCLVVNTLSSNNKVRNIVFSSLLLFFFILFVFVGKEGLVNFIMDASGTSSASEVLNKPKVTSGLITGMVLTGFTLAGSIVQAALSDKK